MKKGNYYTESTMPGIFRNRSFFYKNDTFLRYRDSESWKDISWRETGEKVDILASWLIDSGIQPGDRVAIYSENRPEWVFADLAVLSAGAVDVTVYPTNSSSESAYIINDSGSRICFCSGQTQLDNLLAVKKEMPSLEKIVVFSGETDKSAGVISIQDIFKENADKIREDEIHSRIVSIDPYSLMTLMYTSGTTGNPKGVMLSHNNMVSEIKNFITLQPHPVRDIVLSILPLSHALERSIGYYLILYSGGSLAYSRGPEKLLEDLTEIRPTAFISVPRIPEKIYEGIKTKAGAAPFIKKMMFNWAVKTGKKAAPYLKENKPLTGKLKKRYALAEKLVLSKMRAAIGMDRITAFGAGGAPLSSEIHDFFAGMGIFILPGYGLTETSPVTHCHTHKDIMPVKTGSVGPALPLTETRIADDGEILLRGPQVMMGYYNNPEATEEVFTDDGFFTTGDIGFVDEDGYLFITDRKKDIIITAGGKNISPQVIEGQISINPYIEQVSLIGDQRKYITALIVPAFENLKTWAAENGILETDHEALVENKKVISFYNSIIEGINKDLGRVEQVKTFTLIKDPFTQERGELTPTLKIKRKAVQEHYSSEIEAMYKE